MDNKKLKKLELLKKNKYRLLYSQFLIEGKRIVKTGFDCDCIVNKIYCTEKFYEKNENWYVENNIELSLIEIISKNQFKKISFTKSPSGIAAVCKIPNYNKVKLEENKWIYLDRIRDPGNLGTIFRTAAWFGIKNIALSPESVDPYNPKTIRAGMGAHFYIKIYKKIELSAFAKTHTLISTHTKGLNLSQFTFPKKYVVIFGNEAHGISLKNIKTTKNSISIKKLGLGDSLNISTSASIIMYIATAKN